MDDEAPPNYDQVASALNASSTSESLFVKLEDFENSSTDVDSLPQYGVDLHVAPGERTNATETSRTGAGRMVNAVNVATRITRALSIETPRNTNNRGNDAGCKGPSLLPLLLCALPVAIAVLATMTPLYTVTVTSTTESMLGAAAAPQCKAGHYCSYPYGENCEGSRGAAGCTACSHTRPAGPSRLNSSGAEPWTVDYDAQCGATVLEIAVSAFSYVKVQFMEVVDADPALDTDALLCAAKRSGTQDTNPACRGASSNPVCSALQFKTLCPFLCASCAQPTFAPIASSFGLYRDDGKPGRESTWPRSCSKDQAWALLPPQEMNEFGGDVDSYAELALSAWHCKDIKVFSVLAVIFCCVALIWTCLSLGSSSDTDGKSYGVTALLLVAGCWLMVVWISVARLKHRAARCQELSPIGGGLEMATMGNSNSNISRAAESFGSGWGASSLFGAAATASLSPVSDYAIADCKQMFTAYSAAAAAEGPRGASSAAAPQYPLPNFQSVTVVFRYTYTFWLAMVFTIPSMAVLAMLGIALAVTGEG